MINIRKRLYHISDLNLFLIFYIWYGKYRSSNCCIYAESCSPLKSGLKPSDSYFLLKQFYIQILFLSIFVLFYCNSFVVQEIFINTFCILNCILGIRHIAIIVKKLCILYQFFLFIITCNLAYTVIRID